jgi:hypothetical protein
LAKRLRDELDEILTEAMGESPMVRRWWREGPNLDEPIDAHIVAIYTSLQGLEAMIARLADEVDELKTRL